MRVFIAVDLDESSRREIEKLLKVLKRKHWAVKWEVVDKLHITLAFLGEVDKVQAKSLLQGVRRHSSDGGTSAFTLSFKGLGCFPDYDWPRIVWLGLKGDLKSLAALQKNIEENLTEAGFVFNKKPFTPHITLGRIKKARAGQRREIGRQIKAMQKMKFKSEWLVDKVVVYQSTCLPEGSVYKKLFMFKLGKHFCSIC